MTYTLKTGCFHQTYNTLDAVVASIRPGAGATPGWPNEIIVPMIHNQTGEKTNVCLTGSGPVEWTLHYTEDWSDKDWDDYLGEDSKDD